MCIRINDVIRCYYAQVHPRTSFSRTHRASHNNYFKRSGFDPHSNNRGPRRIYSPARGAHTIRPINQNQRANTRSEKRFPSSSWSHLTYYYMLCISVRVNNNSSTLRRTRVFFEKKKKRRAGLTYCFRDKSSAGKR